MGEILHNQDTPESSSDDTSPELERADMLKMIEYSSAGTRSAQEMKALVFKHRNNKYFRDIFDKFMRELGRDWSDVAALAAELANGHYELPEQREERGFLQ